MIQTLKSAVTSTADNSTAVRGNRQWWPGLDGLRGVAVVLVIVYHLWPDVLPGGWVGVSTFFTLSGFLITSLLLDEHNRSRRIDFRAFWTRRARRLLPAVVTSVAIVLAIVVITDPSGIHAAAADAAASLAYIANWRAAAAPGGYEAIFTSPGPFDHLWSLAVEEQIYLVVPIVFAVALRSRMLAALTGAATAAVIAAGTIHWWGSPDSYFVTPVRAIEVAAGSIAAILARWAWSRGPSIRRSPAAADVFTIAAAAYGTAVIAWVALTWTEQDPIVFRGGPAIIATASVAVLIAALRLPGPLAHPVLRWLGTRSYALYLWHWPLIVLFDWSPLIVIAATAAVSEVSMRLIEAPIRRRTGYGANLRMPLLTLGGTAAVAASLSLAMAVGVAAPRSIFDIDVPAVPDWFDTAAAASPAGGGDSAAPETPIVVQVLGDSTAGAVFSGLRSWGDDSRSAVVLDGSRQSCGPLEDSSTRVAYSRDEIGRRGVRLGDGRLPCRPSIPDLINEPGGLVPDVVVIIDWGMVLLDSVDPADPTNPQADLRLTDAETQDMLASVYRLRIAEAESYDAAVILTTIPLPGDWIDVPDHPSLADSEDRVDAYNRVVTRLADEDPAITLIDTAAVFADDPMAYLRTDGLHLDPGASNRAFVNDWLAGPIFDAAKADVVTPVAAITAITTTSAITDASTAPPPASTTLATTTVATTPAIVMVLGDSTALAATDGLRSWGDETRAAVVINGSNIACNPLQDPVTGIVYMRSTIGIWGIELDDGRGPCRNSIPDLIELADGIVPDEILIVDWGAILDDAVDPADPRNPAADIKLTDPTGAALLREVYETRISEAGAIGATVILTTAPLPRAWVSTGDESKLERLTETAAAYNKIVRGLAAAHPSVFLVDTAEAFADDRNSYPRSDGLHLDPGYTTKSFAIDWLVGPVIEFRPT